MPEIQQATSEIARMVAMLAHSRLEAELARDRAELLTRTDPLTGLENRRQAMAAAEEVLSLAARGGRPFAFTMVDVDHFKNVNDELGHAAGDRVLVGLARLAERTLRPSDRIYRIGGEEFLVVSKETTWEGARRMAERFREALSAHDFGLKDGRRITASFGIYSWNFACGEVPGQDDVLRWADEALYEAKRLGRDRVRLASAGPGLRSLEA